MRKRFEANLHTYRDIAKGELPPNDPDERLETVLDWNLDNLSKREGTPKDIQRLIYDLQKKKQEIMMKLKEDIKNLDNPEYRQKMELGDYRVEFYKGKYEWIDNNGHTTKITLGDIMTDGEWGINYFLDKKSVPRNVRKEYLIRQAKRELQESLDLQIYKNESNRPNIRKESLTRAYRGALGFLEGSAEQGGHLAEKVTLNFMQKLVYDFDLDFSVETADLYEDVQQKVDFIIKQKKYTRGVGVEENKEDVVAIQFTMQTGKGLDRKEKKLKEYLDLGDEEGYSDIVLISIPIDEIKIAFNLWKTNKTPGGPERKIFIKTKEKIYKKLLSGMFSEEELEDKWNEIVKSMTESINVMRSFQIYQRDREKRVLINERNALRGLKRRILDESDWDNNERIISLQLKIDSLKLSIEKRNQEILRINKELSESNKTNRRYAA